MRLDQNPFTCQCKKKKKKKETKRLKDVKFGTFNGRFQETVKGLTDSVHFSFIIVYLPVCCVETGDFPEICRMFYVVLLK